MAKVRLPKPAPAKPLYTRGGMTIDDGGFDPLAPAGPIDMIAPVTIQNPNQVEPSGAGGAAAGARGGAPMRTGAFGYAVRSKAFSQYKEVIVNPPSQAPGATPSPRPIVEIPGGGLGAHAANHGGPRGLNVGGRSLEAPAASNVGMRAASLRSPLVGVGVRASTVGRSSASSAGRVTVTPAAKASAAPAAKPTVAMPTATAKPKKQAGRKVSVISR
jgi:hypothetical protein